MQEHHRSIVLLPDQYGAPTAWYARWCHVRAHFDFISGQRTNEETCRDVALRAATQELELTPRDLLVSNVARLHLEFVDQLPGLDEPQHVHIAFYIVRLYRAAARAAVERDPDGQWLTGAELLSGITSDGHPVNPELTSLLKRGDLIRA